MYPVSYNFITESSDCCVMFDTLWPKIAFLGVFGQFISHLWVDFFPSDMTTLIKVCVGYVFVTLVVMAKKLSVVPESSMS